MTARQALLLDATSGQVISDRAYLADRWWARLRGLLGRRGLKEGEALILSPCSSIHTLGMRFPIDVVFVDGNWVVLELAEAVPPWRIGPICLRARHAIELPSGTIARYRMHPGQCLQLRHVEAGNQ